MKFDEWLLTKEAEHLFCGPDSTKYKLYKSIWDDAQKNKTKKKGKKNDKKDK